MKVEKATFMKKLMDSNCHIVTNAEHCAESIGTRTQVSNLTKEFHRMTFFLQRISVIASTQHLYFTCLNLGSLTGTDRFGQFTIHTDTCTCSDEFQYFFIEI